MKSNKGITIISLLVYIIVLTIVIGTISTLTKYFYENEQEAYSIEDSSNQYSRLITYITDDINSGKIATVEVNSPSEIQLTYNDDTVHRYEFSNEDKKILNIVKDSRGIVTKNIEMCTNVSSASFQYTQAQEKIVMTITINGKTYTNTFIVK